MSAAMPDAQISRSYAEANRELAESFRRYLESKGFTAKTIGSYTKFTVAGFVEGLGDRSAVNVTSSDVRVFLARELERGLSDRSVDLKTKGLRCFFKFLRLAGLLRIDPMLQVTPRKLKRRLPRVLTVEEVERVIDAATNPAERAIVETLYSTGVRVSELCALRLGNVYLEERKMLVVRGKGGKDRWVLCGRKAVEAITEYQQWRPSKAGYLFESPPRKGGVYLFGKCWCARYYAADKRQHTVSIGRLRDFPTHEQAYAAWEKIKANLPKEQQPRPGKPAGPYSIKGIEIMLARLGAAAKVKGGHPHSFRRAFACHLLAHGADIRTIQELLGHKNVTTTQIYTTLTDEKLQEIHAKYHPHSGGNNGKEE